MLGLYKINSYYYAMIIIGLCAITHITYIHIFVSESFYAQWYEGVLTQTQILESISRFRTYEWLFVLLNVLFIFIKIALVAVCLFLGMFFFSNQSHTYKTAFKIALKAEIVFVIQFMVRLLWMLFIKTPEIVEDMRVMPLSLMSFFDPVTIEPWLKYSLNTLNVFEVIYIWMLSALTAGALQTRFRQAFKPVMVSYGAGLALLMATNMFLILNNS